jgi:hypothetical protein
MASLARVERPSPLRRMAVRTGWFTMRRAHRSGVPLALRELKDFFGRPTVLLTLACPLASPLPSALHLAKWGSSMPSQRVILECLGSVEGPRFLNGRTAEGTVDLAPSTVPPYTGTLWEMTDWPSGAYTLRCLGHIVGARFLDGRTAEGTVGLALDADLASHSGTYWEVTPFSEGTFTLRCLGDVDGNRFLDGRTGEGTVGLAPAPGGPFTGAIWGIFRSI